jgi:hypothetical protein
MLVWTCTENGRKQNSQRVLYMTLETRLRGRSRNRWQDEVRDDWRIVGGEDWQKKVYNRQEWKKLLRMARNCHILHMPMEWTNEWMSRVRKVLWTYQHKSMCYFYKVGTVLKTKYWETVLLTFIIKSLLKLSQCRGNGQNMRCDNVKNVCGIFSSSYRHWTK